uniref:hypothetical protein n=1 Tax=Xenorhabdus sp. TH1 TaxID=3130166 RepID=UPI00404014ED
MTSPVNLWKQELRGLHSRLAPLFHSVGSQHRCLAYLRGLLSERPSISYAMM